MSTVQDIFSALEKSFGENLIPLLFGTLGGASVRAWFSSKQKKEENALNMHKEFFGESMYKARTLSEKLVEKYPEETLEDIRRKDEPNDSVHLWIILGFFNRLSLQIQQNQIQKKYIRDLFGELFIWWWVCAFDNGRLPEKWDSYKSIIWLKEWLENPLDQDRFNYAKRFYNYIRKLMNVEDNHKNQVEFWYENARKDRRKVLAKADQHEVEGQANTSP